MIRENFSDCFDLASAGGFPNHGVPAEGANGRLHVVSSVAAVILFGSIRAAEVTQK